MKLKVAILLGPSEMMMGLRDYCPLIRNRLINWHCRRAETPQEKDQQAGKIRREIGSYLKGGTKKIPGITGKEKISFILKRVRSLKISGEDKLIQRLGKQRYNQLLKGAKQDLIKGYLSLAKARGVTFSKTDLRKIPESFRKDLKIETSESSLIRRENGFSRWEQADGRRIWRDEKGHYSKGPRSR